MVVVKMSRVNQKDLPPGGPCMQQQKSSLSSKCHEEVFTLKAKLTNPGATAQVRWSNAWREHDLMA